METKRLAYAFEVTTHENEGSHRDRIASSSQPEGVRRPQYRKEY